MIKSLLVAFTFFFTLPALANEAQIHYVGFNAFGEDKHQSGVAFDAYIDKLRPIMRRYGMTVEAYNVLHGGSDDLAADVITFGTAKDQQSFQAFFQDPEFQAIFPMLVGALSDHQVVFTMGRFAPENAGPGAHTLLSARWLENEAGGEKLRSIYASSAPIYEKYGAIMKTHSKGVYSNRGLGAEVTDTVPPASFELWSVRDAHGLFDDKQIKDAEKKAQEVVSRTEDFWIVPRHKKASSSR